MTKQKHNQLRKSDNNKEKGASKAEEGEEYEMDELRSKQKKFTGDIDSFLNEFDGDEEEADQAKS